MMPRFLFLAVLLAGCAATGPYGNFAGTPATFDQKLAADVSKQLGALYAPASTRFNLRQSTQDAFGVALVEGLRSQGFAVYEVAPVKDKAPVTEGPGVELRYVLDQQAALKLYRVELSLGKQSLARAYVLRDGAPAPAGQWAWKE